MRELLDRIETNILREALTTDPAIRKFMFTPEDAAGTSTGIVAWNHPGDSSYGLLAGSEPVYVELTAGAAEDLLERPKHAG